LKILNLQEPTYRQMSHFQNQEAHPLLEKVRVSVQVNVYVCMHVHVYVWSCARVCVPTWAHLGALCMCARVCVSVPVCVCHACLRVCMHVHTTSLI